MGALQSGSKLFLKDNFYRTDDRKIICSWVHVLDLCECDETIFIESQWIIFGSTVKLGIKELFDKEQIGNKEPFPVTNLPFTS